MIARLFATGALVATIRRRPLAQGCATRTESLIAGLIAAAALLVLL